MNTKDFLSLLHRRKGTLTAVILIFVILGLVITLGQPLKYRAKSRLLILQPGTNTDAYAIARSNEYIGGLISEVVYSGSFLDSLNSSSYTFNRSYFNGDYKDNIKKWKKTVSATSNGDTGVIDIEIYHTDPQEALRISQAVDQLIISNQSPYRFDANQVKLNIIDQPTVSTFPVKPNLLLNFLLSLIFGFLAGCSYIYLFPGKKKANRKTVNPVDRTYYRAPNYQTAPVPSRNTAPAVPDNLPLSDNPAKQFMPEDYPENETAYSFKGDIRNILDE